MAHERIEGDPCEQCLLECNPIAIRGDETAKFLVVCPPATEKLGSLNQPLISGAMRMFAKHMKVAGFTKHDFAFMNSVQCGHDPTKFRAKDKRIIRQSCREYILREIEQYQPEVVIALGADAAVAVEGRGVKITKVRGVLKYNETLGVNTFAMLDPSYVYIHPEHEPLFASDCRQFARLVDNEYDVKAAGDKVLGDYEIVYDLQFLIDQQPTELSYDLETLGLDSRAPEAAIMTIQLCAEEGKAYMVPWDHPESKIKNRRAAKQKIIRQLRTLLQDPDIVVVGANNKFDAIWTYNHLGFRYRIDHDTLMIAAEIDENALDKGQDTLTKLYANELGGYADHFNMKYDKSRMDLIPLGELLPYGACDTDANLRIFHRMYPLLEDDPKLLNHYNKVAMPGINAFVPIEINGQLVNEEALDEFEIVLTEYVEDLRKKLLRQIPRTLKRKHIEKGISLGRADFLIDILFNHENGFKLTPTVFTKTTKNLDPEFQVPSTSSKDHLPYFFTHPKAGNFCMDLAEWMKTDRLLGTNVKKFRENYIREGKIYPSYSLWTAVTGRTSSSNPNGQNIPKRGKYAKAYRKIFVPPPGYVILEADLSQAELRIAANLANDSTMLKIYQDGGDIHRATATVVMGMSMADFLQLPHEEQALARFKAKAVNFGFLYGMWWRKFIIYAKTQYGVEFTEQEAKRIREGFFRLYGALPRWHDSMISFARKYGFVRSYSGKVRHLPMIWSNDESISQEAGRQAINCLSDDTEILTTDGWRKVDDLMEGDSVYSVNPQTGLLEEDTAEAIHIGFIDQDMHHFEHNAFSAIATPNHRWLVDHTTKRNSEPRLKTCEEMRYDGFDKLWIACKGLQKEETEWTDDEVQLMGWVLTDGHYVEQRSKKRNTYLWTGRVGVSQSKEKNIQEIHSLFTRLGKHGFNIIERTGQHHWTITIPAGLRMWEMMPEKTLTPEVLNSMSSRQLRLLFDTMLKGDGSWDSKAGRYRKFTCSDKKRADAFLMLCAMIGQSARASYRDMSRYTPTLSKKMRNVPIMTGVWVVELPVNKRAQPQYRHKIEHWAGRVWCPTTRNGTWVAKRNDKVFITGNSPVQNFASDLGVMSMARITDEVDPQYLQITGFVHDAIYAYVPEQYVEWGAKTLKHYMETNPLYDWFDLQLKLPIVADVGFGWNAGETHEMEGLDLLDTFDFDELSWDNEKQEHRFQLPDQEIPPNNGRLNQPEHLRLFDR